MAQRYLYIEIASRQSSKYPQGPCGDVFLSERKDFATDIIVCDGIGSGFKAHIAAKMCVSRLHGLLKRGFSMRQAFASVVQTMDRWRDPSKPYCAFSLCRILNDGEATVLSYDAPAAVLVGTKQASALRQKTNVVRDVVTKESNCFLRRGEGLILFTDGITQAGIGKGKDEGWPSERIAEYVSGLIRDGKTVGGITESVYNHAVELAGGANVDDMTVVFARCRRGNNLNILTGPPADKSKDEHVAKEFLSLEGPKVVCGATTATIVSKFMKRELQIEHDPQSLLAPPRYLLDGIDLVTEGAVTLNQLCNVINVDQSEFEEESGVTDLLALMLEADRINFLIGSGKNPANKNISFCQKGILTREKIIPLIAEKLREKGKLVVIKQF